MPARDEFGQIRIARRVVRRGIALIDQEAIRKTEIEPTGLFVAHREHGLPRRVADEHGIELDILLQKRRDKAAAKRFFKRLVAGCPALPKKIAPDQLRSYPAAKTELPELMSNLQSVNGHA